MKPSIGRIVHFVPPRDCKGESTLEAYASMISKVNGFGLPGLPAEETVELVTFGPNSLYFQHQVPFAASPTPGCWSWPPKV